MTTATRSVAVVATELPHIDRRALSQAWYSALHLAPKSPNSASANHERLPSPAHAAGTGNAAPSTAVPARSAGTTVFASTKKSAQRVGDNAIALERRSATSDLSRRIERGLVRHVAKSALPATLAINAGDGRVHLLVRSDGKTTRIVALCAPHLRERVDRALAQARFALAAGGMRIEAA